MTIDTTATAEGPRRADDRPEGVPQLAMTRWQWVLGGLCMVLGLFGLVLSYADARRSTSSLHFDLFWLSMFVAATPVVVAGLRWRERSIVPVSLLVGLGAFTFVPKLLMSLHGPVYYDEYGHWRQTVDIVRTGDVFVPNSFSPIMEWYPGLSLATVAIHEVSRLGLWPSAVTLIAVSHVASVVLVFALARGLGLGARSSFLAGVVFALNPSFMYFDTEYSYESFGIMLLLLSVVAIVRSRRATTVWASLGWGSAAVAAAGACAITHHVSSYVMVALDVAVAVTLPAAPSSDPAARRAARLVPVAASACALTVTSAWFVVVAPSTAGYLWPHVSAGLHQLGTILGLSKATVVFLNGKAEVLTQHTLFSGAQVPAYERIAAFCAPVIVAVVVGGSVVVLWRKRGSASFKGYVPFVLLAGCYFLSLPLTLTAGGGEAAHRSWAFSYIGIAVAVAAAVEVATPTRLFSRRVRKLVGLLAAAAIVVVAVGNVAVGQDAYYRFPGPYVFGTDTWSVTPEMRQVAAWCGRHLPPGGHVVTDRFTGEVLTADTQLDVPSPGQSEVYQLYQQGARPGPRLIQALERGDFRYFVLDTRIERELPVQPLFEGYAGPASVSPAALRAMGHTDFARVVHRTRHFVVFRLDPAAIGSRYGAAR